MFRFTCKESKIWSNIKRSQKYDYHCRQNNPIEVSDDATDK